MRARVVVVAVVALTLGGGLTACEPVPPRLALAVTSEADGPDAAPGDGVCATAAGACTLPAAIEEGNLSPSGADLAVPTGTYAYVAPVTGDLRVDHGGGAEPWIDAATWTIGAGGRLELIGVNTSTSRGPTQLAVVVEDGGALVAVRTYLRSLLVGPGGSAILASVVTVGTSLCSGNLVANSGSLVAVSSSLLSVDHRCATPPLTTFDAGRSVLGRSVVANPTVLTNGGAPLKSFDGRCAGEPPESLGWLFVESPCGSAPGAGDGSGPARAFMDVGFDPQVGYTGVEFGLFADSPLVDAIPLGDPACDPTAVDLYGNPRGVDGDGDGVGGCDIGAVERQPDAA